MKIYLTSDHGGYDLKNKLFEHLKDNKYDVEDLGPHSLNPDDDYVDFAATAAKKLASDSDPDARVIMACRTGEGEVIVANRFPGVRAVVVWNEEGARLAREKNDSNALCLSGDLVNENTNLQIVDTWLSTPFSGEERHKRRLEKIDKLEI